jgi:uncharacterized protein with HEPN domain
MEWFMSLNIKQIFGAGLLTLAVIGGTASYLTTSLQASAPAVSYGEVATQQTQAAAQQHDEVVVVEGRAS